MVYPRFAIVFGNGSTCSGSETNTKNNNVTALAKLCFMVLMTHDTSTLKSIIVTSSHCHVHRRFHLKVL